jgi:D-serine deaminase-like pyridoxal phosphate-dependent protein
MSADRIVASTNGDRATKADLPTPALLVDLDLLEANIAAMAAHCRREGCQIRPHAKTHKCAEIARRQVEAGARGISTATVAEAEAMVAAGLRGVLLTSPIVDPGKVGRMVELARSGGEILLAVGHPLEVELLAEAAGAARVQVDVLVDLDVGDRRFGTSPGTPALDLAREIGRHSSLRIRGVQAYLGLAAHIQGFEARRRASLEALARAVETVELLNRSGFDAAFLSCGSTGTYNIDCGLPVEVELQCGSYVFMDGEYRAIGGRDDKAVYDDFRRSLTVLTTVVSAGHPGLVTVDAGVKSFATETPFRPEAKGRPGLEYEFHGDEFGRVTAKSGGDLPRIGDRLEFYATHCDPTVNLFDRLHAVRGDVVEDVWEIAARKEFRPVTRS